MNVIVLGAGRVGRAIALDLAADPAFDVTVVDRSADALARMEGHSLRALQADLSDAAQLREALQGQDLAVGAVPGFMGFETLQRVLEASLDVVDISFFAEDAYRLDALARERGRTALVDCGVAPGCSNLILGRLETRLERVARFECLVGGLPVERRWPWEYKAPFSPVDVLEEYTRPARFRRRGREVTLPALSEVELVDFPGFGTLEAFNTDGLRTVLRNSDAETLVEKTLRYPGHADRMRALRDAGFFDPHPVEVDGEVVRPLSVSARLLFDAWRYEPGEEDVTLMRITVEGTDEEGRPVRHVFQLMDRYDRSTATSSMARTTGYTCTALVRLVANGRFREPGVFPPEMVGRRSDCFDFVLSELGKRGVRFEHTESPQA